MEQPTGLFDPKVKAGRRKRSRRGGADAQYPLGKWYTNTLTATEKEEFEDKTGADLYDITAPSATAYILDGYGPDKEAEVKEALVIAKGNDMLSGDVARKLEGWLARNALKGAQGMLNLGPAGLGPRSNPDTESRITGFLSGETGSTQQQKAKLEAKARQGGRRTRKRKTRTAKKSRRNYK
jgi:hypothetical protein